MVLKDMMTTLCYLYMTGSVDIVVSQTVVNGERRKMRKSKARWVARKEDKQRQRELKRKKRNRNRKGGSK